MKTTERRVQEDLLAKLRAASLYLRWQTCDGDIVFTKRVYNDDPVGLSVLLNGEVIMAGKRLKYSFTASLMSEFKHPHPITFAVEFVGFADEGRGTVIWVGRKSLPSITLETFPTEEKFATYLPTKTYLDTTTTVASIMIDLWQDN